jgi:class 3 adenylate cyclase/tetratricopeptide (TPR) repeat protein
MIFKPGRESQEQPVFVDQIPPLKFHALHPFVPVRFCQQLGLLNGEPRPVVVPHQAVMIFADISGFSRLASELAEKGTEGAEELMHLLDSYFGRMVELMQKAGGHIIKFAGDALIGSWLLPNDGKSEDETWQKEVLRVVHCAHEIRRELNDLEAAPGVLLGLKLAVSAGKALAYRVGGEAGHWELVVSGEAIRQFRPVMSVIERGEVLLSPQTWPCIASSLAGEALASGEFLLEGLITTPAPYTNPPFPSLTDEEENWIRRFVPETILLRVKTHDYQWLAELRWVTVAFLGIRGLNLHDPDELFRLHEMLTHVQRALAEFNGALDKLQVDEKGISVLLVFGVPPTLQDRREQRALATVSSIFSALEKMGLQVDAGLASGRTFCGPVGNANRCQNSMMSKSVNLGARLMQLAKHEILSDPRTVEKAGTVEATRLESVSLKGFSEPIAPYKIQRIRESIEWTALSEHTLVGREEEMRVVSTGLRSLLQKQTNSVLVFSGEAGIGKSHLAASCLRLFQSPEVTLLTGAGQAVRSNTAWHVWQPVFFQLTGLEVDSDVQTRRKRALKLLQGHPELEGMEALLNPVFQIDFEDSEKTALLDGPARSTQTNELLLTLLKHLNQDKPTILLLDDAHWFDSSSWRLLVEVVSELESLLVVMLTRPLDERIDDWQRLQLMEQTVFVEMEGLSRGQVKELLTQRLSLPALPDALVDWVFERGQGSPFVSLELALALKDTELWTSLQSLSDTGLLEQHELRESLDELPIPDGIEGIVVSRVDRLEGQEQLALKTASVLGAVFTRAAFEYVFPGSLSQQESTPLLNKLVQVEMLQLQGKGKHRSYSFTHRITQEAAYGLLLRQQRQELHEQVALWFEQSNANNLVPFYPELAFHWSRTENDNKTLHYIEQAGQAALHNGAYFEARGFYKQALRHVDEQDRELSLEVPALRKAGWAQKLGDAYYGMGIVEKNIRSSRLALSILSIPMPDKNWQMGLGTLWNITKFTVLHLLPESLRKARSPEHQEWLRVAAMATHRICNAAYSNADSLLMTYTGFLTSNYTLRLEPFSGSPKNLALLSLLLGWFQLPRMAMFYFERSLRESRELEDLESEMFVSYCLPFYLLGEGREWERFESELAESIRLCKRLGNQQELENCLVIIGSKSLLTGELDRLENVSWEQARMARKRNNALHECWSYMLLASHYNLRQQWDKSVEVFELWENAIESGTGLDEFSLIVPSLLKVEMHWKNGNNDKAVELYEQISPRLYNFSQPVWTMAHVRSISLKFCLSQWQSASERTKAKHWEKHCRQLLRGLQALGFLMPIARPHVSWAKALIAYEKGRTSKAIRLMKKALQLAQQKSTRVLEADIHTCLAKWLPSGEQSSHRQQAETLMQQLKLKTASHQQEKTSIKTTDG